MIFLSNCKGQANWSFVFHLSVVDAAVFVGNRSVVIGRGRGSDHLHHLRWTVFHDSTEIQKTLELAWSFLTGMVVTSICFLS